MNEKVSVLSVLDEAVADNNCLCGHPKCSTVRARDRAVKARSTAADMIEALRAFIAAHDLETDDRMLAGMQMGCAYEMARAAIAQEPQHEHQ